MSRLAGVGQIAHGAVVHAPRGPVGEGFRRFIPRLDLHFGKIHAPPVHPWGRAGLESPQLQAQTAQTVRQSLRGVHPVRAGGIHTGAGNDGAVQIGPGGHHHGLHRMDGPQLRDHGGNRPVFGADLDNLRLFQGQIFLQFQGVLHIFLIPPPVRLGPQGMDRRTLAPVEHPVLDAGMVGGIAHFAPQCVQFPDQVALAGAADGGIAGHIAHSVQIDGKYRRFAAQPGAGQARFDASVAGADHRHVKGFRQILAHASASAGMGWQMISQRLMGVPRA